MADTFTNLLIHFVFSTKHRIPFLQEPLRERTYEYIGGIVREERGIPLGRLLSPLRGLGKIGALPGVAAPSSL